MSFVRLDGRASETRSVMRTASFGHDPVWQSAPAERLAEVTHGARLLKPSLRRVGEVTRTSVCALPPACVSTRTASPRASTLWLETERTLPVSAHRALVSVASRAAESVQLDRSGERRRRKPGSMVRSDRAYRRNPSSMANPRAHDRRSGIPALAGMDRRFVLRESGAPLKSAAPVS